MKPTRPLVLVAAALVAAILSFGGIHLWAKLGTLPGVPASAPITPAILAAIILATAIAFRSRLHAQRDAAERVRGGESPPPLMPGQRAPKPIDPLQAARAAMFAKASSMVGTIVAGVYGGYGAYLLLHLAVDAYKGRAVVCGLAVLAGLALVGAALFLEHVLRVPPVPPEEGPAGPSGTKVDGKTSSAKRPVRRPEGTYPVRRS